MPTSSRDRLLPASILLGALIVACGLWISRDREPRYRYTAGRNGVTYRTDIETGERADNRGGHWATSAQRRAERAREDRGRAEAKAKRDAETRAAVEDEIERRLAALPEAQVRLVRDSWPDPIRHLHQVDAIERGLSPEAYVEELMRALRELGPEPERVSWEAMRGHSQLRERLRDMGHEPDGD